MNVFRYALYLFGYSYIARSALTAVIAPMGYGKTTAANWYLAEYSKTEPIKIIRVSVYSDNLAIFWKNAQDAFVREGFDFPWDYDCPTDAAGSGLLSPRPGDCQAGEQGHQIGTEQLWLNHTELSVYARRREPTSPMYRWIPCSIPVRAGFLLSI